MEEKLIACPAHDQFQCDAEPLSRCFAYDVCPARNLPVGFHLTDEEYQQRVDEEFKRITEGVNL